jgi:F420-dependent methylenetetrahydromethanopterin dehydrogenase
LKETLTFTSEFLPKVTIAIVLSDNPNYENLKPLFDDYGYGFMIPNKDLIVIDGEQFINNFNADVLKFIEAHEIAHIILGHDGPRNEGEELEADLGAYILLKQKNRTGSIKELLKNFKTRHGIKFDEKLLEIVKNSFS